jgi:hypothetical protein
MPADRSPSDPTKAVGSEDDEVVIDLRDSVVQKGRIGSGVVAPREIAAERDPTMSGRPMPLNDGFRVTTIGGGDQWMAAEAFVYDVYRSCGFCKESALRRVEELQPWAPQSTFHAVVDGDDQIVGTIRTIDGVFPELPIGQFERTDFSYADPACELSSLAVERSNRGTGVIEHLYRAGWLHGFRTGARSVVGLVDAWLFEVFRDFYGLPFTAIGVSHYHMGGDLVPIGMHLRGATYDDLARRNPEFWRWTLEAIDPRDVGAWGLPIVLTDEPATAEMPVESRTE